MLLRPRSGAARALASAAAGALRALTSATAGASPPPAPPSPAAPASPPPALSLSSAFARRARLTSLALVSSADLRCQNALCGGAGGPCVCRLSSALESLPLLAELDLSCNGLTSLPPAVWAAPRLRCVRLRGNAALPGAALAGAAAAARTLEELDVRRTALARAACVAAWLPRMTALRALRVGGCPLAAAPAEVAALRALLPPGAALDVDAGEAAAG
jgi:hypothetical protein